MKHKILNFPGYYITTDGKIYSYNGRWNKHIHKMKTTIHKKTGYEYITLCKNGKKYLKTVHRLMAEIFLPNPENKPEVNHKNGIRTDNRVENLEWTTHSENVLHAFRVLNRKKPQGCKGMYGKLHPNVKIVIQFKDGKIINEYYGANEAGRYVGRNPSNITSCCRGRRKQVAGYQWKYKED